MKSVILITKNDYPIAFAETEKEAKEMIMNKSEKYPELWDNDAECWWNRNLYGQQTVYQLKELTKEIE